MTTRTTPRFNCFRTPDQERWTQAAPTYVCIFEIKDQELLLDAGRRSDMSLPRALSTRRASAGGVHCWGEGSSGGTAVLLARLSTPLRGCPWPSARRHVLDGRPSDTPPSRTADTSCQHVTQGTLLDDLDPRLWNESGQGGPVLSAGAGQTMAGANHRDR
jgi:hypothetical protein